MMLLLSGAVFVAAAISPLFAAVAMPRVPHATIAIAGNVDLSRGERRGRLQDRTILLARIVSAYHEAEGSTLQIDKGAGAGVRVGMTGRILMGAHGADPLPGGNFTISAVVGSSKSLARTEAQNIGKNTRVAINLAPLSRRAR